MDFSVITVELVAKLLLLLLIGMGPKIALVPFLEKTKKFDAETQRAIGRQMVRTAVITALVLFAWERCSCASFTSPAAPSRSPAASSLLSWRSIWCTAGQKDRGGGGRLGGSETHRDLPAGGTVSPQSGRHHRPYHRVRRGRLGRQRRARRCTRPAGRRVRLFDLCQHRQAGKASESHQAGHFRGRVRDSVHRGGRAIGRCRPEYAR